MEKRYKYMDAYLSRDLLCQKIHPLRDAAFGADCSTSFKIFKIITVGFKKMDSGNAIKKWQCCKNCQSLICSPVVLLLLLDGLGT